MFCLKEATTKLLSQLRSAALIAVATTFAAPSFAMDNQASNSLAQVQNLWAEQKAAPANLNVSTVRATTFSAKNSPKSTYKDDAHSRLFRDRTKPAGR